MDLTCSGPIISIRDGAYFLLKQQHDIFISLQQVGFQGPPRDKDTLDTHVAMKVAQGNIATTEVIEVFCFMLQSTQLQIKKDLGFAWGIN